MNVIGTQDAADVTDDWYNPEIDVLIEDMMSSLKVVAQ